MRRLRGVVGLPFVLLSIGQTARAADGGAGALEAVALPAPVACTFTAKSHAQDVRLELAPGVPYTELGGFDALELSVPVAPAPAPVGVKVQLKPKGGEISLEGLAAPAAIPLRPRRSFVLGQLFLPSGWSEFHWAEAAAGEVEIELTLPPSVMKQVKDVDRRLRARRRCDDLGIEGANYDAYEAAGGHGLNESARLKPGAPVPVASTPGGPPIARLIPRPSLSESTFVMERRDGWTRINVSLNRDLDLVGWVPDASLRPPPKTSKIGEAYGVGGLGLVGTGPPRWVRPFTCDHDVPLIAEAMGQRRMVGTLGAGVRMEDLPPGSLEFAVMHVDELIPSKGARFLARRADIEGCTPAAP